MRRIVVLAIAVATLPACNLFGQVERVDRDASADVAHAADITADVGLDASHDSSFRADSSVPHLTDAASPEDAGVQDANDTSHGDVPNDNCGNGSIETDEECEPDSLTATCFDLGSDGGRLRCNPATCTYDTSDCYSCDYYIAPETGDDTKNGRTPATAWRSAAKMRALVTGASGVNPGERICLRRGETMGPLDSEIEFERSGTPQQPIIVTHYGEPSARLPVVTASIELTPGAWNDEGAGVFSHSFASAPPRVTIVWMGTTEYLSAASGLSLADGDWFLDGATLYFRPGPGGITDVVHVAITGESFDFGDDLLVEYVEIDGIAFDTGEHGVELSSLGGGANHIYLRNCTFRRFDDAIRLDVGATLGMHDIRIENNDIQEFGNGVFATSDGASFEDALIRGNTMGPTIRTGGRGIAIENAIDGLIEQNQMRSGSLVEPSSASAAIELEVVGAGGEVSGNVIRRNYIEGFGDSIVIEPNEGAPLTARGNFIVNNLLVDPRYDGIQIETCDDTGTTEIAHNTVVGAADESFDLVFDCGTNVRNNLSVVDVGGHVKLDAHPVGEAAVADTIDSNVYVPGDALRWELVSSPVTWTGWLAEGYDANSMVFLSSSFVSPVLNDPLDYRPAASFAVVDAAMPLGYADDYAGRSRPVGSAPDIGAFERQPDDP